MPQLRRCRSELRSGLHRASGLPHGHPGSPRRMVLARRLSFLTKRTLDSHKGAGPPGRLPLHVCGILPGCKSQTSGPRLNKTYFQLTLPDRGQPQRFQATPQRTSTTATEGHLGILHIFRVPGVPRCRYGIFISHTVPGTRYPIRVQVPA